jgi:hypothetical protein
MAGAAESIGSAVGSAQRQLRRGIELVRRPAAARPLVFPFSENEISAVERAAREGEEWASLMAQELVEKAADARHQVASQLDAWSEEAVERLELVRGRIGNLFSRSRERAQRFVAVHPLQTVAAIAGICFAAGVALRLGGRSHRG